MRFAYPIAVPDAGVKVMAWCDEYENAFWKVRESGYDGVELLVRDPEKVDRRRLNELLSETGLSIAAIGTTPMQRKDGLFIMHEQEAVRREAARRLDGVIKLAAVYQAPVLFGKYRGMCQDGYYQSLAYLEEIVSKSCRLADESKVEIFLEPQNKTNINNLNTIPETLAWIEEQGHSNLKILADVYHMGITEPSITEALVSMGDRLGMIHMSDSERLVPGQGSLPIAEVTKQLAAMEFNGFVSLEIKQEPNSETAARESIQYLKQC